MAPMNAMRQFLTRFAPCQRWLGLTGVLVWTALLAGCAPGDQDTDITGMPLEGEEYRITPARQREAAGKLRQMGKEMAAEQVILTFHGRVVDDTGQPLPGVEVVMTKSEVIERPPFFVTRQVLRQTDAEGRFSVTDERGEYLGVRRLSKPGYQWLRRSTGGISTSLHRTREQEAEIVLHRQQPRVWLWPPGLERQQGVARVMFEDVKLGERFEVLFSLLGEESFELRSPTIHRGRSAPLNRAFDLRLDYKLTKDGDLTVTLTPQGAQAGIQAAPDVLVLEAPETGYAESLTVSYRLEQLGDSKFFVARTRDLGLYWLLDLRWAGNPRVNKGVLILSCRGNPFGERNLDYSWGRLVEGNDPKNPLRKRVLEALVAGRLPEKPDFTKFKFEADEAR